jgi:endonuclease G, mitochondrial
VQVPVEYWKVAVLIKADGTPSATAYLQTQRNFLGQRDFEFGAFRTYQVKVSEIERLTGLTFADLDQHDPLARTRGLERGHEIKRQKDIVL